MDNKITDKGWAAMRELLDREMPEKPRRRFGWWWFALMLLPLAGYGGWQWLGTTKGSTPALETELTRPIANHEAPIAPTSTFMEKEQQANASNASPTLSTKDLATKPSISKKKQQSASANYTHENLDHTTIRIEEPIAAINPTEIENNHPYLDIAFLKRTESESVLSTQIKGSSPQHFPISETPKIAKNNSKKRWSFGATTAISTEQFNMINGFSTGVTVDWKFARKWGLRMGAVYNIHTPQEKYRPVASVQSADYRSNVYGDVILVDVATGQELISVPGANFYGDSLTGNVFIPVNRLQRLEVPITVFWQAARPLKVIGGFSLTRTLTTKAASQNYSGDYILKLADQTAEDGASKLSSSELDNWSVDATIGAGIKVGKSFEIGAFAKMPLNKFPGIAKTNQPSATAGFTDKPLGSTRKQNGPVFSVYTTLFF